MTHAHGVQCSRLYSDVYSNKKWEMFGWCYYFILAKKWRNQKFLMILFSHTVLVFGLRLLGEPVMKQKIWNYWEKRCYWNTPLYKSNRESGLDWAVFQTNHSMKKLKGNSAPGEFSDCVKANIYWHLCLERAIKRDRSAGQNQ